MIERDMDAHMARSRGSVKRCSGIRHRAGIAARYASVIERGRVDSHDSTEPDGS